MAKTRQLTIRDDAVYEQAHALARRLGVSVREAVQTALSAFEPPKPPGAADTDRELRLAELNLIRDKIAATAVPRTQAEDDAFLYDERGLPR